MSTVYYWARSIHGEVKRGLTAAQLAVLLSSPIWVEWGPMPVPLGVAR